MLKFITDNWDILSGVLALLYELCVRIFPTEKNRSIIDFVFKVITLIFPNKSTKTTYVNKQGDLVEETKNHIVKIIVLLMVCALPAFSQNNATVKSLRSYHADSLTVKTEALGLWLLYDTGKVGVLYYEPIQKKWRVLQDTTWYDLLNTGGGGTTVNFGTTKQVPYMNGTNNNFLYTSNFTFDGTNRNLLVGTSNTASGSTDQIIVGGSNTITGGGWGVIAGEQNTVTGGGGDIALFGLRNTTSKGSTLTYGTDCSTQAAGSFAGGYNALVNSTTNVPGFSFGLGAAGTNKVLSTGGAFNMSTNTTLGAGLGALAPGGGILGGTNNYIPSGAVNSIILGGRNMSMLAADTSYVYVPNLRVRSGIGTGTRMLTVDATGHVSNQAIPSGTTYTGNNGLTLTSTNFQLGGDLVQNTNITGATGTYGIQLGTSSNKLFFFGNRVFQNNGDGSIVNNGSDVSINSVGATGTAVSSSITAQNTSSGNASALVTADSNSGIAKVQIEASGNTGASTVLIDAFPLSGSSTGTITIDPNINALGAATSCIILKHVPTSSAGLPSGAIWSNAGVLTIVP